MLKASADRCGDRLEIAVDVFNPDFHRLELLGWLGRNRGLHLNILYDSRDPCCGAVVILWPARSTA